MGKIIEAGDLPNDEKVYLKKDFLGWRVVEPIKKDINEPYSVKNTNWFNLLFGGKKNLLMLIILAIVAIMLYNGVMELNQAYKQVADNPCSFCTDCQKHTTEVLNAYGKTTPKLSINYSQLYVINKTE